MKKLRIVLVLVTLFVVPRSVFADDPGYSLKFDGMSDFVRLSTASNMLWSGWQATKTVSLWVKPTGSPTYTGPDPASCDAIFGDRPRSWGIARGAIGGIDRIWVWNYDGTFDRIGVEYTIGEWVQITLVHGGGLLRAYKNGVLVGSVSSGATPATSGQATLQFGGVINNASKNWSFEGEIDELRLWNIAQTEAEILQDLNRTLTGTETGLAAYYKMSNGSGTSLTDDSGHSWTGTLTDGGSGVPADGSIAWVFSGAFGGSPNIIPVADPQSVTTVEDNAVALLLTGADADGDVLTFQVVGQPAHGVLTGAGSNLTYTPAANFSGADAFSFVVNDGLANSGAATVALTVTAVNDPPVADDDAAATEIDTQILVQVLNNDVDVDGDPLTIIEVGNPLSGTVTNNVSSITYTPNPGFTGTDSFTYTISDDQSGNSTAEVTVTVQEAASGYALRFDGTSDFVRLAKTAQIMAPGWETTKTVELWVKPTGSPYCRFPDPASCDAIFGDRPRWWGISQGVINGLDRISVWNWDGGGFRVIWIDYTPGQWVHIAMVHGAGTLRAYKNGVFVGSVTSGATQQPNQQGAYPILHFGGIINSTLSNFTFKGEIDEVRLWNTARTEQEINLEMNRALNGTELGLAAYYQMSDGSGTSLTDDSGHGWTGTLNDGASGVPADGPILWVLP